MRLRGVTVWGLGLALTLGGASPASAQTGSVAIGAVVGEAVSATTLQNLLFGTVFPGVARVVATTSTTAGGPYAGLVYIKGQKNKDVLVSFTLPDNLANGTRYLPIDTYTGCYSQTNTTTGCTPFTPTFTGSVVRLSGSLPSDPPPRNTGHGYIFVGATVRPAASQAAGTYTGTVIVSVVYF